MRKFIKQSIKIILSKLLGLFNKSYLLEYWGIKRNEAETLSKIAITYSGFVYEGMKIFDIGANLGHYSQVFLNMGAKVIAIEPQTYCQQILNKRLNQNQEFRLYPLALGAREGNASINIAESHTISSMNPTWVDRVKASKRFKLEHWNKTELVKITTLDKLIRDTFLPDYIKIDVEGYELEVLKGLSVPIDVISFEITLPETKELALASLELIGTLATYEFTLQTEKLNDANRWMSLEEMTAYVNELAQSEHLISTDIFCRKLKTD